MSTTPRQELGGADRSRYAVIAALVVLGCMLPVGLLAQDEEQTGPPDPTEPDSVQLVFEREVFSYPAYERRNPFSPLTGDESGPRFEQLRLTAVLMSPAPGQSIAMLASGSGESLSTWRVRQGEVLGNMRVISIQPRAVVVEVDEFGVRERRTIEMPLPGYETPGTEGEVDDVTAPPDSVGGDVQVDPDSTGAAGATGVDPDSTGVSRTNGNGGLA